MPRPRKIRPGLINPDPPGLAVGLSSEDKLLLVTALVGLSYQADSLDLVYFLDTGPTINLIKIGYTSQDCFTRVAQIQRVSPIDIQLLGVSRGGRPFEHWLHSSFAQFRHRSEWYVGAPVLRECVRQLVEIPELEKTSPRDRRLPFPYMREADLWGWCSSWSGISFRRFFRPALIAADYRVGLIYSRPLAYKVIDDNTYHPANGQKKYSREAA